MLAIKRKLPRCINQDDSCLNIRRNNAAANHRIVLSTTAIKFPCSLKQFEKLPSGIAMFSIRGDGNHFCSSAPLITQAHLRHRETATSPASRYDRDKRLDRVA